MKTSKTNPVAILIGKTVIVNRTRFSLRYTITNVEDNMVSGTVSWASEDSPYQVGTSYSLSVNELKYFTVISK